MSRENNVEMTDKELDKEFNEMWYKAVKEVTFFKPKATDGTTN